MSSTKNCYAAKYMLIYVNCVTISFDNKKISKMIKVTVQGKEKKW